MDGAKIEMNISVLFWCYDWCLLPVWIHELYHHRHIYIYFCSHLLLWLAITLPWGLHNLHSAHSTHCVAVGVLPGFTITSLAAMACTRKKLYKLILIQKDLWNSFVGYMDSGYLDIFKWLWGSDDEELLWNMSACPKKWLCGCVKVNFREVRGDL